MISLRTVRGSATLSHERHAAARRLSSLVVAIDNTQAHEIDQLVILRAEVEATLKRIGEIDRELDAGKEGSSPLAVRVGIPTSPAIETMSPRDARHAVRRRLHILLTMLSTLPTGCDQASAKLRAAIKIDLQRLADSRANDKPKGD